MLVLVDVGQAEDIQRVSCCVYMHCLEVVPVLVRQWWKDQDRKSAAFVDKWAPVVILSLRPRTAVPSALILFVFPYKQSLLDIPKCTYSNKKK